MPQYLIAFIDILGYSEMINTDDDRIEWIPKIISENIRLNRGKERYSKSPFPHISVVGFSDSIVFTVPVDREEDIDTLFEHFLTICNRMQYSLLKKSILARGSICFGDHKTCADENITYFQSKAYIKAVAMEKKAVFPIILLEHEVLELTPKNLAHQYFLKDRFGNCFLNYLQYADDESKLNITRFITGQFLRYKADKNESILLKYLWLESYLNWSYSKSINTFEYV